MKKISIVIVIFVTILLSTGFVYAKGGGQGEPGSGCSNPFEINFQYVDPPYNGNIQAVWHDDGVVTVTGLVEKEGNRGCIGQIPSSYPCDQPARLEGTFELIEFQSLKSSDIKGFCLIGYESCFTCGEIGYYEIVSIGNLDYSADGKSFTAKVIIKLLQEKLTK